MPLPKVSTPTYELELPSTGQTIEYRPFLVREEKLLVLSLESEDMKEITKAIKTVIKSCIKTKNIKVESLPTFDIEYLFLNIRGKSVGEQVEVKITAPDDGETPIDVTINIDDIKVKKNDKHTNKIKIDDNLIMEMKYPSLDQFIKSNFDFSEGNNIDQSFDMIANCVDKIYNQEEVWSTADVTKKEVVEFLEQLNTMQFKEIEQFFDTMPRLSHEVKVKNPKTKVESTVVLEGLASFFG
jgi:hypothetical protein